MTTRPANFIDAHQRHWEDAEFLHEGLRWANADHLYGISAECGLKALMALISPLNWPFGEPIESKDKVHVNYLDPKYSTKQNAWDRYQTYLAGSLGTRYTLAQNNPFQDWDISDRYAKRTHFSEASVIPHRQGAEAVRQLVQQAQKESEHP